MRIDLDIPAIPVAQPRQRHRVAGRGQSTFIQNYTPTLAPVNAFKATVRLEARRVYSGPPLDGPLGVRITFLMPRPSRLRWKKRPMPRVPSNCKPDLDNLEKSLLDALTGLIWRDDAQVAVKQTEKLYAAGDEKPGVHCSVFTLPTGETHGDGATHDQVASKEETPAQRPIPSPGTGPAPADAGRAA